MLLITAPFVFLFFSRPPPGSSTPSKLVRLGQGLKAFVSGWIWEENVWNIYFSGKLGSSGCGLPDLVTCPIAVSEEGTEHLAQRCMSPSTASMVLVLRLGKVFITTFQNQQNQNQQSFLWEMSTCDPWLWMQVEVLCQKGVTVLDAFQDSLTKTWTFLCRFPKSVEIVARHPEPDLGVESCLALPS